MRMSFGSSNVEKGDTMNRMRSLRRILLSCAGLIFMSAKDSVTSVSAQVFPGSKSEEEQQIPEKFSKNDLIRSLQQLKRNPEKVQFSSAMCYDMAVESDDIQYQCEQCGTSTVFKRGTDIGNLALSVPGIRRSLALTPYDVAIDASALCPVCGEGKEQEIVIHMNCFNCGKQFSWPVRNWEDVRMLRWLYLKHPVTTIDERELGSDVAQGVEYIRDHVFCPECREKVSLD